MASYELRARTSVAEGARQSFSTNRQSFGANRQSFAGEKKGANVDVNPLDVEEGEVSKKFDDNGPVEFEEKKDLK